MSKPNVLVLGGVGFIGRNFVKWLVDKGVAGKIRVIDKVLPATAFLGKEHQDAFNHPSVEYKQGNLTSIRKSRFISSPCCCIYSMNVSTLTASIQKCLTLEDGGKFTYVFNLAAETKYGQTDEVPPENILSSTQMIKHFPLLGLQRESL